MTSIQAIADRFFDAAAAGDTATVKEVLAEYPDAVRWRGYLRTNGPSTLPESTALHFAIGFGHENVAALLLDAHADADARNGDQRTPLIIAAQGGRTGLVTLLLENGADVNLKSPFKTPLMYAAENGKAETVKALLDHHARINDTDNDGWSALHFAGYLGQTEAIALLIERGADVSLVDDDGLTVSQMLRKVKKPGWADFIENLAREKKRTALKQDALAITEKNFRSGAGKLIDAPETATFSRKKALARLNLP